MVYDGVIKSGQCWPDIIKCLSQDPEILLPGIYPEDLYVRMEKEIGMSGFVAVYGRGKHCHPQRGDNTRLERRELLPGLGRIMAATYSDLG